MIGIDEVGRGCWAGPLLVVAARQKRTLPATVTDSKAISAKKRVGLVADIDASCELGEGWVTPAEIDQHGLSGAMRLAVERALRALKAMPHEQIIMDGNINYCSEDYLQVRCVVGGDKLHAVVSAASIIAKVRRDQYMVDAAKRFPGYGFDKHVGYGTAQHRQALQTLGICELHRQSYKPVQEYIWPPTTQAAPLS